MILGAVAAINQKNIKRLIAYSSISHMGYAIAGISTGTESGFKSTMIYILIYHFLCRRLVLTNDILNLHHHCM